jgi:hypothetical protein
LISFHYQKKRQELGAILEAFRILNNNEHRSARQLVYSAAKQYDEGMKDIFKNSTIIQNSAAMVRADMDQIGLLVINGLIPRDLFLSPYLNTVIICWKALKDHIEDERKERRYPRYMKYFETLYEDAERYARENNIDTKEFKQY